jgi:hypothetical protein
MSPPGIEPGPRPSQSRVLVRHTPRTIVSASPARESNPALRLRRPPCARHTRENRSSPCPRQESNLVFNLRKVACSSGTPQGLSNPCTQSELSLNCEDQTLVEPRMFARIARRPRGPAGGHPAAQPIPRTLAIRSDLAQPRHTRKGHNAIPRRHTRVISSSFFWRPAKRSYIIDGRVSVGPCGCQRGGSDWETRAT